MMMTYQNAIDFLYNRTDFERKNASSYRHQDFKLERMRALLEELGNPNTIPAVHIAGTKGKGSTAHMVAAGLQASGIRTGLFTSPHLENYEERIRINGVPIDQSEVTHFVELLKIASDNLTSRVPSQNPTFFELTTALAWLAFQSHDIQIAVMEVGLGGRLDSTNLCNPLVTAITSIGLDHTQQLGDTIEQITAEKAGILKSGIPVISGCSRKGSQNVIRQKCDELQLRLWEINQDIQICNNMNSDGDSVIEITTPVREHKDLQLSLLGEHQIRNLAVAVAILDCLQEAGVDIEFAKVPSAIRSMQIPGRQEIICRSPLILLDVAHNEDSNEALISTIKQLPPVKGPRVLIFGSSRDKDYKTQLRELAPLFDRILLTSCSESERACNPDEMLKSLEPQIQPEITVDADVKHALNAAQTFVGEKGALVISGSFYLAGEVRTLFSTQQQKKLPQENVVA